MEVSKKAFIISNSYSIIILNIPIPSSPSPPFENLQSEISSPILLINQSINSGRKIEEFNLFSDPFIIQDIINTIYIFN